MKNLISRPRFAAFTILSSLCAPFLIATQSAQAAPPVNAPAFGFRRGNSNRNVTVTGVVTSDSRGQDRFRVRLNDGRNIEVISRKNEPKRLSNGDRVTMFGDFENGLFIADKMRVVENVGNGGINNGNQNITVVGTVTRDLVGQDRFTVRLENGRTTQVISRDREPLRLSKGDRVQLRGDFENGLFIADRVRILDNAGNGGGNNGGQSTTLRGRVTRDFFSRDFEIDRDNGGRTRVRSLRAEPIRLSQGDRVEIKGRFEGSLFIARDVNITRNDDRQKIDFPATVLRRTDAGHMTVRGENGRTYKLVSNVSMVRFDRDDRVRVKGTIEGDTVFVSSVTLLKNR